MVYNRNTGSSHDATLEKLMCSVSVCLSVSCFIFSHTATDACVCLANVGLCVSSAMFLLIFQSLCAHKISFVHHFTRTHLYVERRVWNVCKNIFWKEHLCALQVLLCALISRLEGTWTKCMFTVYQTCISGYNIYVRCTLYVCSCLS